MEFTHIREPYGTLALTGCIVEEYKNESNSTFTVIGTVKEGVTRSFMLGYSHVEDEAGSQHEVYNVSEQELKQGYKRSIAM